MPDPTIADLIRFVDRWKPRKIVVAGDFMLDCYIYGNADRLSPDAPVPVLTVVRHEEKPGGAANVCLDLRALRCQVACLGLVGRDATGTRLRANLKQSGCDVSGILPAQDRPTTIKQNFVGLAQQKNAQKLLRVDVETREGITDEDVSRLLAAAGRLLRGAHALCLEDYNKGVLSPRLCRGLIALARKMKVPILVDPAAIADYGKYRGVTCITPNRPEAALATSIDAESTDAGALHAMARKLVRQLGLEAAVLTLDKQGALLLEKGGKPVLAPAEARQVYDVTGAGDMVLAMLAAARANGADWRSAVQLANIAAGLEVEKFGIVPIPLEEILLSLLHHQNQSLGKQRSLEQILPELEAHRAQGRKIVFTNGCFDILHAGHVSFLRQARRQGDLLVVGLNSDASIRRIKGPSRPVNQQDDRVMVLGELQSVDYICVFSEDTPLKLIRAIIPDVLVKVADYQRQNVVGGDWVERHGGKVVLVDLVAGRSTTNIIQRIAGKKR